MQCRRWALCDQPTLENTARKISLKNYMATYGPDEERQPESGSLSSLAAEEKAETPGERPLAKAKRRAEQIAGAKK